jgi:hypothetical protein
MGGSDREPAITETQVSLAEPGALESFLGDLGRLISSGELDALLSAQGFQRNLQSATAPLAGELVSEARSQADIFNTPEAQANLISLFAGQVPEQSRQLIDQIAASNFQQGAGLIRGATESRGLRTGDLPAQQQFQDLAGQIAGQRAQQLLTFPQQQAAFQQQLRQQAFANRAGLLEGTGQLGLALAGIPAGATQGFLGLEQNPRLAQSFQKTVDVPSDAAASALSGPTTAGFINAGANALGSIGTTFGKNALAIT